jgi:hypothetical protein
VLGKGQVKEGRAGEGKKGLGKAVIATGDEK